MLSHALISLQTCLHWRAIKNTAHKSKCLVLECRTLGWAYATKTGEKKKTTVTQFAWGWTSRLCGEEKEISEPGLKTGKKKKKKKIRSSRSTASHSRNLLPTPREKRQKNKHHISAGHFRKQFTYRCGCGATLPESCVSRTGEARRRCMCVCVCVCVRVHQAETGAQRRRSGTFGEQRNLVAERSAPGCGNIRLQTADERRAVQPGRGAPGSHTAPAVTHSLPGRCGWWVLL